MSVEKIKEFINDIYALKKSKNSAQVNIWTSQLKDMLGQFTLSEVDISQMNAIIFALQKDYYLDNIYDNLELFLKLLSRKELKKKTFSSYPETQKIPINPIGTTLTPDVISRTIKTREGSQFQISGMTNIQPIAKSETLTKIFIVHGHDEISRLELVRILEKMGLEPITLHEKPNQGKTIMEKFEKYSKDVNFAFVLLTPDDIGGTTKSDLKKRARQNVILELGFFISQLGRAKVCCLHKSEVELPTDYLGVIFLPFVNSPKECYEDIIRELKSAGFNLKL